MRVSENVIVSEHKRSTILVALKGARGGTHTPIDLHVLCSDDDVVGLPTCNEAVQVQSVRSMS